MTLEEAKAIIDALIRPASANVDQAMIIFAAAQPAPNLGLLDRFLLMMERQELPTIICFNKQELISGEELDRLCSIYRGSGCSRIFPGFVTVIRTPRNKPTTNDIAPDQPTMIKVS